MVIASRSRELPRFLHKSTRLPSSARGGSGQGSLSVRRRMIGGGDGRLKGPDSLWAVRRVVKMKMNNKIVTHVKKDLDEL